MFVDGLNDELDERGGESQLEDHLDELRAVGELGDESVCIGKLLMVEPFDAWDWAFLKRFEAGTILLSELMTKKRWNSLKSFRLRVKLMVRELTANYLCFLLYRF